MTKNLIAIALLATAGLALTACGGGEKAAAEHETAAAEHAPEHSSAGLPAGNIEAGEKLATAKGCAGCHGADGNAPTIPDAPKLGGQYGDYIAHSLQGYRDGRRENATMSAPVAGLTDQEIADLSAYFASRPSQLRDLKDTTL